MKVPRSVWMMLVIEKEFVVEMRLVFNNKYNPASS